VEEATLGTRDADFAESFVVLEGAAAEAAAVVAETAACRDGLNLEGGSSEKSARGGGGGGGGGNEGGSGKEDTAESAEALVVAECCMAVVASLRLDFAGSATASCEEAA